MIGNATVETRGESRIVYSKGIGPLRERAGSILICDSFVDTRIVGLLFGGSPSTILRGIRTIVINTVNGMARRWPWSHISIESCEIIAPLLAHDNATSTIVMIFAMIRVVAACFHADPYLVLGELG